MDGARSEMAIADTPEIGNLQKETQLPVMGFIQGAGEDYRWLQ
jgi:hypothetical protein